MSFPWEFSHTLIGLKLRILKIEVINWMLMPDGLPQLIFVPLKKESFNEKQASSGTRTLAFRDFVEKGMKK